MPFFAEILQIIAESVNFMLSLQYRKRVEGSGTKKYK